MKRVVAFVGGAAVLAATVFAIFVMAYKPGLDMGTYPVMVNRDLTIAERVTARQFTWVNSNINDSNFTFYGTGIDTVTMEFVAHQGEAHISVMLAELEKHGLRPATLQELMAFGEHYTSPTSELPILSIESAIYLESAVGQAQYPYVIPSQSKGEQPSLQISAVDMSWRIPCYIAGIRE
jgi:hypothetical protein